MANFKFALRQRVTLTNVLTVPVEGVIVARIERVNAENLYEIERLGGAGQRCGTCLGETDLLAAQAANLQLASKPAGVIRRPAKSAKRKKR